jgi:hypothetical protein
MIFLRYGTILWLMTYDSYFRNLPGFFPNGAFSGAGRIGMAWTASSLQDYVKNKPGRQLEDAFNCRPG